MAGHARIRGGTVELRVYAGRDPLTGAKTYRTKTVPLADQDHIDAELSRFANQTRRRPDRGPHTMGELLEAWFEKCSPDWSPSGELNTRSRIDTYLFPLHGRRLDDLGPHDLDVFYGALRKRGGRGGRPLTAATVRRTHTIVRSALDQALRWGWIDANPAVLADPGRVAPAKIVPPAPDEVARLIDATIAILEQDPDLFVYLTLAAELGPRRSELSVIRWTDRRPGGKLALARSLIIGLDSDANQARYAGHCWPGGVRRGTHPTMIIEKPTPKNPDSDRLVSLSAGANALLDGLRRYQTERAFVGGLKLPESSFVFAADILGGRPLRPDTWSHRFRRVRASVGLESVRLHDLRHFVATSLIRAGVDLTEVAGKLGHGGGGATTLRIYAHFLPGSDELSTDVMTEVLARARTKAVEQAAGDGGGTIVPLRARRPTAGRDRSA